MVYKTGGLDESFHILIDIANDVITRWGVYENVTQELLGQPGEGTSIDFDEPFVIRFECDEDGWMLQINDDHKYQTFFHLFSPELIETVQLKGQADISYIGFGTKGWSFPQLRRTFKLLSLDLTPAPPVGFNLTFICPEGKVFEHDWFATPFVMMTCQVGLLMGRLTLTIAVRPLESLMSLTGTISSVSGVSHYCELVCKSDQDVGQMLQQRDCS